MIRRTHRLILLGQILGSALVLGLPVGAGGQSPAARAEQILAGMPAGSPAERGAWLYGVARQTTDAQLARRLMQEIPRRCDGRVADRARLWLVRYAMAAGDTAAAAAELSHLDGLDPEDALMPQARFWRNLLGRGTDPGLPDRDETVPPWGVLGRIAAVRGPLADTRAARGALAVEGAARRWGLLGPWLWRLVQSDNPWLTEVASVIAAGPGLSLAGCPEWVPIQRALRAPESKVEPAPAEEPAAVRPVTPQRRFAVQVGAFADRNAGRALTSELVSHGFPAYEVPSRDREPPLYRVRLGPCATLAAAESLGVALSQHLMLSYQIVEEEGDEDADGDPPALLDDPPVIGQRPLSEEDSSRGERAAQPRQR